MKDMDNSKYIVPIFVDSILIGTGVLHNSLLITVAHVIEFCRQGKFFDVFFRQKMTSFCLHFSSRFFKNENVVKLDISRILRISFFVFIFIFFAKKQAYFFAFFRS